jgi:hypothetical protein
MRWGAIEEDRSFIRPVAARQDSDKRAFSSPVVADQGDDLAPVDAEIGALQRMNVAEAPDNPTSLDQRRF